MQKITNVGKYLLELSFLALLIKFIFFSAEIGIALAIISLIVSMSYNKWLNKEAVSQYQEIITQLKSDKAELLTLIQSNKVEMDERLDLAFGKIGNLTLDNSIKNVVTSEKSQKLQGATKRFF